MVACALRMLKNLNRYSGKRVSLRPSAVLILLSIHGPELLGECCGRDCAMAHSAMAVLKSNVVNVSPLNAATE